MRTRCAECSTTYCNTEADEDGLTFDLTDLKVNQIREEDRYGGIRAKFLARLGSARIPYAD